MQAQVLGLFRTGEGTLEVKVSICRSGPLQQEVGMLTSSPGTTQLTAENLLSTSAFLFGDSQLI